MKITRIIPGLLAIFPCLTGCGQSANADSSAIRKEITTTTTRIIEAVRKGDKDAFEGMIDKNYNIVHPQFISHDISVIRGYIQKYYPNQNPPIEITNLFNMNGQMLVKVCLFQDSANVVLKRGDFRLLFGPTGLAPLSRITGYEIRGTARFDSVEFRPYSYWHPK